MFFGTLITVALIDIVDTLIKIQVGLSGPPMLTYSAFMLIWILISALALVTRNRKLHALYAPAFLLVIIVWVSFMITGILDIVADAT